MKIREFLEGKKFPVKVVPKTLFGMPGRYIEFLGMSAFSVLGFWDDGSAYHCSPDYDTDWQLYVEPKKKVKMWQWALRPKGGRSIFPSDFYKDEETLFSFCGGNHDILQRIEGSMIEVEEEQ